MTNVKQVLLAATALSMLGSAAWAGDGNKAYVYQGTFDGSVSRENSAGITQSGKNNEAGNQPQNLLQHGQKNKIVVLQSGDGNDLGLTGNGVEQYGYDNSLSVQQTSNSNVVGQVIQSAGKTSSQFNASQGGLGGNVVTSVRQTATGEGKLNVATVTQTGAVDTNRQKPGTGSRNSVGTGDDNGIIQNGASNNVGITQDGQLNSVNLASQTGSANTLKIEQLFDANSSLGNNLVRSATQNGASNTGTITQRGQGNVVGGTSQSGNSNGLTITQFFADNRVDTVSQTGNRHRATITQNGGTRNVVGDVLQAGGDDNTATVTQIGFGNNLSSLTQLGSLNTASLTFTGDDNGVGSFGQNDAGALKLKQGTVFQSGHDNSLAYNVTGNKNLFAFSQTGHCNQITGSVNGSENQAAVVQTGAGNLTAFQQNGTGNIVGVSQ